MLRGPSEATHVETRIAYACRVHVTKDAFKVGDRRKVRVEIGMLPMSDTWHDFGLEVCLDHIEGFAFDRCVFCRARLKRDKHGKLRS